MSWKPEVQTAGDGDHWSSNALRFATEKEAKDYVFDLAMRWTAVSDTRVVECEDEVTHAIVETGEKDPRGYSISKLVRIEEVSSV